ncbi:MAG: helix-turn-helix transcriptional regulator [Pseudonocardiales bacterium]|nr:helix-turn-helix transcriptional regulator [Pseudonocardiales bacterium]
MTAERRAFAERREVVGHSQETLARLVGVQPTTVGRWEWGETCPQPWCRPELADALSVSVEELNVMLAEGQPVDDGRSGSSELRGVGELLDLDTAQELPVDLEHDPVLAPPWNHRGTVEVAVVLRGSDRPVERRGFVFLSGMALTAPAHQWLVHEPGPLVSGLSGRRVSAGLVDRLRAMIPELRAMDDLAGGGTVLALVQREFGVIAELLDLASYDQTTGRKLHGALAELGQLAGWAAYDSGQPGLAQRYYVAALRAAHSADDRPLGAHILGSMAYQAAREGYPRQAVTLVETAVAGVRGRETPSLLTALYSRQAYALATLRDPSGCVAAISKTRTYVERLKQEDEPPYLYWVGPGEVTAGAGRALLQLGQADQAVNMLEDGIALFDESFIRDRTNFLIRLAEALAHPGPQRDLDAAAGRGMAALELSENLDSTRGVGRLRDLYRQMKPHAKVPAVGDFLDRARGLVTV